MAVVCYPQPNKGRSRDILRRFAAGSGGRVQFDPPARLEDGPAAFFGVVAIEYLLNEARDNGRDWYYLDNSWFDATRKVMTRVGVNALQGGAVIGPDWKRFAALNLRTEDWKRDGRHIVICMQSPHFMREVARWPGGAPAWQEHVLLTLKEHTDRPIVVRHWSSDKAERAHSLQEDLRGAWALITHASAAANEAVLAGVPAFVTGKCAALPMASGELSEIEKPRYPDGREEWAAGLAARQWTLQELQSGEAWRAICGTAG